MGGEGEAGGGVLRDEPKECLHKVSSFQSFRERSAIGVSRQISQCFLPYVSLGNTALAMSICPFRTLV